MSKLLDYVKWRGDLSFAQDSFNSIDAALFSQLSLFNLDDIVSSNEKKTISEVYQGYLDKGNTLETKIGFLLTFEQNYIFEAMSKAPRFKDLIFCDYVHIMDEESVCQFEAFTVDLGDKLLISYGGTDDSIVGWREDFYLMFLEEIESHKHGRAYLKKIADKYKKEIIICGHSKGANIAMETILSTEAEIFEKVSMVYCFDGPGIGEKIYEESILNKRLEKVVSYLPYHSSIGRLFKHCENCKIVDSSAKFAYQHDIVNWHIMANDFIYKEALSKDSDYVDKFIKEIMNNMSLEQRKLFVNAMFNLASSTGAKTLTELSNMKLKLVKNFFKAPKKEREVLRKIIIKKMLRDSKMRKIIIGSLRR